jgi:hypothetical protein
MGSMSIPKPFSTRYRPVEIKSQQIVNMLQNSLPKVGRSMRPTLGNGAHPKKPPQARFSLSLPASQV